MVCVGKDESSSRVLQRASDQSHTLRHWGSLLHEREQLKAWVKLASCMGQDSLRTKRTFYMKSIEIEHSWWRVWF